MGLKKVFLAHTKGNIKKRVQDADRAWTLDGSGASQGIVVSGRTRTTRSPVKSTAHGSGARNSSRQTSQQLTLGTSPITTSLSQDSLARLSALLVSAKDLTILEVVSSMRSRGSLPLQDLAFCSLKTSQAYSHTITGEPLDLSSRPFRTWGIYANGRYLTARTSESHRIGRECSLSDILEKSVDKRYFLSEKAIKTMIRAEKNPKVGYGLSALIPITIKARTGRGR